MQEAGFTDFVRGKQGSDTQHLSSLEYQIKQDTERLKEIQKSIEEKAVQEKALSEIHKTYLEIDHMGKSGITGKVSVSKEDFELLTELAKEGISGRGEIQRLKSDYSRLIMQNFDLQNDLKHREKQLDALATRCRPYWQAAKIEPERVKAFLDSILEPLRRGEEKKAETILYRKGKVRTGEEKEQ